MKKVVLGMSGGVDSSVALHLLKEAGFDVIGVSLKYDFWSGCASENACCTEDSLERAREICANYKIPHKIINVENLFKDCVIDYFKKSLKDMETPSPCVFCNPLVKFRSLIVFAKEVGASFVATGHYARVESTTDETTGELKYKLLKARDLQKDQTYSLSFLTQNELSKIVFPLGNLTKEEVYRISENDDKIPSFENIKQSQDFCFLTKGDLTNFIKKEIGVKKGKIVDISGAVLGEHEGLANYTIGQRKLVGLPGGPYYVFGKNKKDNTLVVAKDLDKVCKKNINLKNLHFISGQKIEQDLEVFAKLRSSTKTAKAILRVGDKTATLDFEEPQFAPTPGQVAVFYKGDECLGAGVIEG